MPGLLQPVPVRAAYRIAPGATDLTIDAAVGHGVPWAGVPAERWGSTVPRPRGTGGPSRFHCKGSSRER